jgi:hypothetical protein
MFPGSWADRLEPRVTTGSTRSKRLCCPVTASRPSEKGGQKRRAATPWVATESNSRLVHPIPGRHSPARMPSRAAGEKMAGGTLQGNAARRIPLWVQLRPAHSDPPLDRRYAATPFE